MDYGKYKYELAKKEKQSKKNRHVYHVKEIKLRTETSEHDIEFKLNHAKDFLKRGDKVKFTVVFRGREALHKDIGRERLVEIKERMSEYGEVESNIRDEGRNMTMIMAPKSSSSS
jgi:translation initiation factor IF-3